MLQKVTQLLSINQVSQDQFETKDSQQIPSSSASYNGPPDNQHEKARFGLSHNRLQQQQTQAQAHLKKSLPRNGAQTRPLPIQKLDKMPQLEVDQELILPPTLRGIEEPMDTIKLQGGNLHHSPTHADGPALNFQTRLKHFNQAKSSLQQKKCAIKQKDMEQTPILGTSLSLMTQRQSSHKKEPTIFSKPVDTRTSVKEDLPSQKDLYETGEGNDPETVLKRLHLISPFSQNALEEPISYATKLSENVLDTIDIEDRISSGHLKSVATFHTSTCTTAPVAKEKPSISDQKLEPANFEKEKVFMLQQDSSRSNSVAGTARLYGQGTSDQRHETSFESLNSVDHLFVTIGTQDNRSSSPSDTEKVASQQQNYKASVPPLPLRKKRRISIGDKEHQSNYDDSIIEKECKKINEKLNTFTLNQFQDMRTQIQKVGFPRFLKKQAKNTDLDSSSFADLPSELMITEDNRSLQDFQVQCKLRESTTAASKKLHSLKRQVDFPDVNDQLKRKLSICHQNQCGGFKPEILHKVTCTGFNIVAPQLIFSSSSSESRGIIDQGRNYQQDDPENPQVGGPLFLPLLTPNILRTFVKGFSQVSWLSCGFEHCIAVTQSGSVLTWGYGASGCLGHGDYVSYLNPKLVTAGGLHTKKVVFAESGGYHSGVITQDGDLYTWGRGDTGQLGLPVQMLSVDKFGKLTMVPQQVRVEEKVKQIALGEAHTVILDEKGNVYTCGWSELGQLGVEQMAGITTSSFELHQVKSLPPCIQIGAGAISSLALTHDKKLFAWGSQQNGQLGLGHTAQTCLFVPTLVNEVPVVTDFVCGDSNVVVKSAKGTLFGWGRGKSDESKQDAASFAPRRLQFVETDHFFLLQEEKQVSRHHKFYNKFPDLEPIMSVGNDEEFNMLKSSMMEAISHKSSNSSRLINPLNLTQKLNQEKQELDDEGSDGSSSLLKELQVELGESIKPKVNKSQMLNLKESESRLYDESEEFIQSLNEKNVQSQSWQKPPSLKRDKLQSTAKIPSDKVKKTKSTSSAASTTKTSLAKVRNNFSSTGSSGRPVMHTQINLGAVIRKSCSKSLRSEQQSAKTNK